MDNPISVHLLLDEPTLFFFFFLSRLLVVGFELEFGFTTRGLTCSSAAHCAAEELGVTSVKP